MKHKALFCITATGILTALSVVLTRYLGFSPSGSTTRLTLGNIPVIMAGIFCGPLYGAVCGILADCIGCFASGYAPNIPLSVGMGLIGVLPPLFYRLTSRFSAKSRAAVLSISVVLTNLTVALLYKTAVLSLMFGSSFFPTLVGRLPFVVAETVADAAVLCLLIRHPFFSERGVMHHEH